MQRFSRWLESNSAVRQSQQAAAALRYTNVRAWRCSFDIAEEIVIEESDSMSVGENKALVERNLTDAPEIRRAAASV